ncbi:MAG: enoyl-CoA hydratase/isomerase family protein [Motiliproteus sp.]|nr:enoyl-CoA hydratase/isomerase family protein [Motiliproteus sp.]MCW9051301.1 enoyl-CoA hydratase/isomerase family protein [Motiliproteus sp.]
MDPTPNTTQYSSHYTTLNCLIDEQTIEIRLNRPQRLNAVVEDLYLELLDILSKVEKNTEIRAVILTGEGRAFCVGADLKEHAAGSRTVLQKRRYLQLANDVCMRLFRFPKPIIAAVNGYALGAGAEMAICCDYILMAEEAQLGFPEVSIGTCVGGGVSQILPRLVGLQQARRLLFEGNRINGETAVDIGLARAHYSDKDLLDQSRRLAQQLAAKAPISFALVKQLLNQGHSSDLETAQQLELDGIATCMASTDWQEGIDAFAEKRTPRFTGC